MHIFIKCSLNFFAYILVVKKNVKYSVPCILFSIKNVLFNKFRLFHSKFRNLLKVQMLIIILTIIIKYISQDKSRLNHWKIQWLKSLDRIQRKPLNVIIMRYKVTDNINRIIDAHGLKIQGRGGVAQVFAKIPEGSRLSGKIAREVLLFRVLLHFYSQVFWNLPGGVLCLPSLLPPCVHL